ncbi:MAG: hypothetical protein LC660_04950, partial [Desulfobacteraceae bacterium]|nr:hypothetical protein [Desulfobacteraceae bacterium]
VPVVCVWVAGLLLAGSDGPFMPWLNGLGALVFAGAGLVLARMSSRMDAKNQKGCPPQYCPTQYGPTQYGPTQYGPTQYGRPQPMAEKAMVQEKESPGIGRPYAVGF